MGADFSKFVGVPKFWVTNSPGRQSRKIRSATNGKESAQKKNERSGTTECTLTSSAFEFQKSPQSKQN
jgi:hypothetical protein